jgi:hypothetical protein
VDGTGRLAGASLPAARGGLRRDASSAADAIGDVRFHDLVSNNGELLDLGTAPIVNGRAILVTPDRDLMLGTNLVYASYDGDADYAPSNSNTIIITVTAP